MTKVQSNICVTHNASHGKIIVGEMTCAKQQDLQEEDLDDDALLEACYAMEREEALRTAWRKEFAIEIVAKWIDTGLFKDAIRNATLSILRKEIELEKWIREGLEKASMPTETSISQAGAWFVHEVVQSPAY